MTETLLTLVPIAIGFAISPIAIAELIMVLFSRRSRVNAIAFIIALLIGVAAATLVGLVGVSLAAGGESSVAGWVLVALGAILLLFAARNVARRADRSVPKVLSAIENMGPGPVVVLALGISLFNPKNLPVLLGAGDTIGSAGLTTVQTIVALVVFIVLATLPFLAAAAYRLLGGASSEATLERFRVWLLHHNRLIMGVVLAVLGVAFVAKGLAAA